MDRLFIEIRNRLTWPAVMLVGVFILGTIGYMIIGWGRWSLIDCAFMTAITLSGVGYGDILNVGNDPVAIFFTMFIIILGIGIVLYSLSTITAFVVEGGITLLFKERKMQKRISRLSDHLIVAGAGSTGIHVVEEMYKTGKHFVVIEQDHDIIEMLEEKYKDIHYIEGDGTDDANLIEAGIERARGIVACLSNDKDNLYITVSAKNINPGISVVARAVNPEMKPKLERVGADHVVSPNQIGGLRMASEILRPNVVTFLDKMLRAKDRSVRFGEVVVEKGSQLEGKTLADSGMHNKTKLLAIAVKSTEDHDYIYNPSGSYKLKEGTVLIVIGNNEKIKELKALATR